MKDPRKNWPARLSALTGLVVLFVLVLLFYRKVALTNLVLVDYDLLTYFYPYKEAAAAALREGRLPLWNPYLFTGVPFLANPQTALFYPLNLPGYALAAPQAVKYSIVFHVFLAGVFMYAFARSSLGLGWAGAAGAALSFMFGGFLTQQVGHINQLNAAVWLPLVLLLFDRARETRQLFFALLGGVALAAQILAGHSQETFLLLVASGLYFLYRLAQGLQQGPGSRAQGPGSASAVAADGPVRQGGGGQGSPEQGPGPRVQGPGSASAVAADGPVRKGGGGEGSLEQGPGPRAQGPGSASAVAADGPVRQGGGGEGSLEQGPRPRAQGPGSASAVAADGPVRQGGGGEGSLGQGPRPRAQGPGQGARPLSPWERVRVRALPLFRAPFDPKGAAWTVLAFAVILALGAGLSMAQLLPTLELSQESIRGGGLPYREAVSFSLPPWLLARSLLPAFQDSPFSEYIAYSGVIPLILAAYGLGGRRPRAVSLFWLALGLLALFLAIGGYNPLYELLYKVAPPLRLFRVPARWLYLYAFAISALAGIGAHRLVTQAGCQRLARSLRSLVSWAAAALLALASLQWYAVRMGEGASTEVLVAWAGLLMAGGALVHFLPRLPARLAGAVLLLGLLGGELFFAGSFLGANSVTAPQAYQSLRPTVAQILQDPSLFRVLSIPRTDFDPGDLAELKEIFGKSLNSGELYQFMVALKHQEVLSPNISMKYGIATLDGYDGGVLPLRRYVEFKELLLDGTPLREAAASKPNQADALLRDQLAGIPNTGLLGLLNVKYVITDKQGDLWLDNVYYDLSAPVEISPGEAFASTRFPGFQATAVGLVYRVQGAGAGMGTLGEMLIRDPSGRVFQGVIGGLEAQALPQAGSYFHRLDLAGASYPSELSVRYTGAQGRLLLRGISLIDARTGASETLTLNPRLRLVHSGDLKVYENLDWKPRAFVMERGVWAKDDRDGLELLRRRSWDDLVLTVPPPPEEGPTANAGPANVGAALSGRPPHAAEAARAEIAEYRPEHVQVRAEAPEPAYLVLTDSYYPGWRAYLDGQEVPILRADYIFRAVELPAGAHVVEFKYEPDSFRLGLALSLASVSLLAAGLAGCAWRGRRRRSDRQF